MTKAHHLLNTPKAITLPGAPEILTMIDENGKHHIQCDICGLVIILKEMHKYMTSFLDPSIKPPHWEKSEKKS